MGPETTSDDGLVGDYARRRPAAAAFGAAATSTTLLQQRGACNSCCTFGTCLRSPSWDLRRRLRRRAGRRQSEAPTSSGCQGAAAPKTHHPRSAAVRVNRTALFIPVFNSVVGPPALCRTCGTATHAPDSRQAPATCVTGVAGSRRSGQASFPPQPWRGWRLRQQAYSTRGRSRLRSAGHSAPPPADGQEPAAFDTGVAGPRRSTFSLGGLVYFGEAGGGNDGSGGDSGGASCAAAPPLRSGSGLLQQAVGTRLVVVGSQSAAH